MTVRIVTDSTSDIAGDIARDMGITVVPQNVHFGTRSFEDNVTITSDEFYRMLEAAPELPTTSQASPGRFRQAYEELSRDADGIVSIHVSSKLSGTCNSARQGASAIVRSLSHRSDRLRPGIYGSGADSDGGRGTGDAGSQPLGGRCRGPERGKARSMPVPVRDPRVPSEGWADRKSPGPGRLRF